MNKNAYIPTIIPLKTKFKPLWFVSIFGCFVGVCPLIKAWRQLYNKYSLQIYTIHTYM